MTTGHCMKCKKKQEMKDTKSVKTKKVVIEAHCDERGSKAYNQKLSKKRAKAVKDYLVKKYPNLADAFCDRWIKKNC